jgi:UDP-glucose-4-epimerase GalE
LKIVVTGAAGFIGGETLLKLVDAGHDVLAIDRVMPPGSLIPVPCQWHTGDFSAELGLDAIKRFCPDAIIHCAGTSLVGPSVLDPQEYYNNNFIKTKILLDYLVKNHDKKVRFIFSSSAATYGNPVITPIQEIDPAEPISPYGESKLMVDWMLKRYAHAYGLDYVSFRYFNACGADSQAKHGQAPGATHIIARVLESVRDDKNFTLYGIDYPTEDGTCVRDYIHVEDLAAAHILATDRTIPSGLYNLGTNTGHSNLEIIQMVANVTKKSVLHVNGPQREGDPAILTADASKFMSVSGWQPKFNLQDIVTHAWAWYNR